MIQDNLNLFNQPYPLPEDKGPGSTLKERFVKEFNGIEFTQGDVLMATYSNGSEAIAEMAQRMVFKRKTSKRSRQDADLIHLLARFAWHRFVDDDPDTVYAGWESAISKGNRGVVWESPGNAIGVRGIGGGKDRVFFSKQNKHRDRVTAFALGRVSLFKFSKPVVDLIGVIHRHQISRFVREREHYLYVNIPTLEREGLIHSPESLRALVK